MKGYEFIAEVKNLAELDTRSKKFAYRLANVASVSPVPLAACVLRPIRSSGRHAPLLLTDEAPILFYHDVSDRIGEVLR